MRCPRTAAGQLHQYYRLRSRTQGPRNGGRATAPPRFLTDILTTLGIAPPPPAADQTLCPSLYCDETGNWFQCQGAPSHSAEEQHTAHEGPLSKRRDWFEGHPRSLRAMVFTSHPSQPREYLYCGATVDPDDSPTYTCNRRVAHKGQHSPNRDKD
ncbi:hypothetical protein ACH4VR_29460 [Streptomyces sp. NPDC020883]|uniref:hypothetical protein n=1 Tax=Streptomyces sp. NPDC020883 TaxID=3365099 RepID=UPI00379DDC2F